MVVIPLCFVLSLPHLQIQNGAESELLLAEAGTADVPSELQTEVPVVEQSTSAVRPSVAVTPEMPPSTQRQPTPAATAFSTREKQKPTRVALLPDHRKPVAADAPVPALQSAAALESDIPDYVPDAAAVLDMAAADEESIEIAEFEAIDIVPVPGAVSPTERTTPDVATTVTQAATKPESGSEATSEFVPPQIKAPSYFDATGHLSMAGGELGAIAGSTPPQRSQKATEQAEASNDHKTQTGTRSASGSSRRPRSSSRNSRARSTGPQKNGTETPTPIQGIDSPWVTPGDGFGAEPNVPLIDVILQQPLESRRVSRMENVVAISREKGWPIALVRSDLPDDFWWVQQMVGVRGNAFAARVNFGNDTSLPGSVYHMVFVFLDSPDEVRRFRIAKQFKEVPEGVRRSREFTFVRK